MAVTRCDLSNSCRSRDEFGIDDLDSVKANNRSADLRCSAKNTVHFRREVTMVERSILSDGTPLARRDCVGPRHEEDYTQADEKTRENLTSTRQRWRPKCLTHSVDIPVALYKMLFSHGNLFCFKTHDTSRLCFPNTAASPVAENFKSEQKPRLENLSRRKLKGNKVTSIRDQKPSSWPGFWKSIFVLMFILEFSTAAYSSAETPDDMPHQEIKSWATTTGNHLSTLVDTVTKFSTIEQRFNANKPSVTSVDGSKLVKEMSQDMSNMMGHKLQAVKRIMNVAEESYKDWASKPEDDRNSNDDYYLAKKINVYYPEGHKRAGQLMDGAREMNLSESKHFDDLAINTSHSTIHVPTNVYDRSPKVLNAIRWSDTLDRTFSSNYDVDPTLHWQYFGSAVGFLRQYPGSKWDMDDDEPDLYDARLRSWYIQAANNPKDMIILLDVSGSMTGLRQEIAKHVVLNILDTLNENDFVNIFIFSETTVELVGCFNDTLVQANLENIGEFKMALAEIETGQIANISQALTRAFTLLASHNKRGLGAQCNQAIMLITDGAPYKHYKIFEEFNWPQRQVRLFTYLIGREITDIGNLLWMACANKGYFVHVSTLAEVREQVLQYIPVIARPLVMYRNKHPHIWTGVYADVAHEVRGHVVTSPYNPLKILTIAARPDKVFLGRHNRRGNRAGYRLMTTVAVPVFDLNLTSVKTANLLGVAGTDVPIDEIAKLAPPYQLGVNGYSFIVNQNGHVLYHPDLRPVFQDILKPNYNSVDFTEVELPAANDNPDLDKPRYNHSTLMSIRQMMIKQEPLFFIQDVKLHMDNMKRVVTRRQEYHAFPIEGTPFSLGIALPNPSYAFNGEIEISRTEEDVTHYFRNGSWNVHPEWVYCQYKYEKPSGGPYLETPEAVLLHFLKKARMQGWKWRSTRTIPPTNPDKDSSKQQPQGDEEKRRSYFCDKTLIQSLLFDAKVTDVYNESASDSTSGANQDYYNSTGINTAFVATRSGLTRWQDTPDAPPSDGPHFLELHNRATDEVWYRRAVDYYEKDKDAYVYSVPFDAGTRNLSEVLMTVTRAVYVRQDDMNKAPVAVVGVTVTLAKFIDHFINATKKCSSSACKENMLCTRTDLDCYLLDDSGFIIASEKDANTGRFFGEIEGTIMNSLVMSDVYNKVRVYDYQAVCLDIVREGSMASILQTPLQLINWTVKWLAANFLWVMVQTQLYQLWDPNEAWAYLHGSNLSPYAFVEPAKETSSRHEGGYQQRKHRAYADDSYRNRQAFGPAGHYRPYSHGDERAHRTYGHGSYGNRRPFAQGEYGQRGTGAHGTNDYGYAQRGPGRTPSFANNDNNYNNYPDAVDYDPQLPFATEGTPDYDGHGDTQEATQQDSASSINQENGAISASELSPAHRTAERRSRRYTETVVEVVKGSNEKPYDIAFDYETALANVSLIEREEIAIQAVDYDDLFESETGEDEDAEYHDEFLAEEYDDISEDYAQSPDAEGFPQLELAYINKTRPRPCDKQVYLYNLNNDKLKDTSGVFETVKGKLSNCHTNGCGRPFSVQKIMKTNLVLIVVDNRCPCESQKVDIEPTEVPYSDDEHCDHLLSNKYRRRPKECISYHPDEWPEDFEEVPRPPIPIAEERIKICAGCSYGPSVTCVLAALITCLWYRH